MKSESQKSSVFDRVASTVPRRIALIVMLTVGVYVIIPRLAGVTNALRLMRRATVAPLLAGVLCQAASVLSHAYVAFRLYLSLGPPLEYVRMLEVTLAAGLANLLVPSAGLSGMAVRVRYLRDFGFTADASLFAFALEMLGQGVGHCILLTMAWFGQGVAARAGLWRPLALLLGSVMLGCAVLVITLSGPDKRNWRYALLNRVNAILVGRGRQLLSAEHLETRLIALHRAVRSLGTPAGIALLVGNLVRVLGGALCLHMTLRAFAQSMPLYSSIACFTLSDVLGGITTLPGGLVVTETALSALLVTAGVPLSASVATTLTFRLIALWLPRVLGAITWYDLQRHSPRPFW
jgi:uncharacterized protein (TIRG00374 family)